MPAPDVQCRCVQFRSLLSSCLSVFQSAIRPLESSNRVSRRGRTRRLTLSYRPDPQDPLNQSQTSLQPAPNLKVGTLGFLRPGEAMTPEDVPETAAEESSSVGEKTPGESSDCEPATTPLAFQPKISACERESGPLPTLSANKHSEPQASHRVVSRHTLKDTRLLCCEKRHLERERLASRVSCSLSLSLSLSRERNETPSLERCVCVCV